MTNAASPPSDGIDAAHHPRAGDEHVSLRSEASQDRADQEHPEPLGHTPDDDPHRPAPFQRRRWPLIGIGVAAFRRSRPHAASAPSLPQQHASHDQRAGESLGANSSRWKQGSSALTGGGYAAKEIEGCRPAGRARRAHQEAEIIITTALIPAARRELVTAEMVELDAAGLGAPSIWRSNAAATSTAPKRGEIAEVEASPSSATPMLPARRGLGLQLFARNLSRSSKPWSTKPPRPSP